MYKNQLQELAQRSCFNLPSYVCVREGPDHAPRFKASVNFNGEIFQGPSSCNTLRQAEHAAAEVALSSISSRTLSRSLAARVLDETGVYKNLLQETTHRAGLKLPVYTTVRSGPGHQPVFTSTVEFDGMCFAGEQAKTKKQAEKNAAMAAWSALKQMSSLQPLPMDAGEEGSGAGECGGGDEQEQVVRVLSNVKPKIQNEPLRQREQYQQQRQRKMVAVGYNEGTSSASPHHSPRFHHLWRSSESLADFPLLIPSFRASALPSVPKAQSPFPLPLISSVSFQNNSSSSLFHPTSGSISPMIRNSAFARSPEIQTLLKGKDEEVMHDKAKEPSSSVFTLPLSPSSLNFPNEAAPMLTSPENPLPRMMKTGGIQRRGIAPSVQIRSVIPVCAAPPLRPPTPPPPPPPPPSASAQNR